GKNDEAFREARRAIELSRRVHGEEHVRTANHMVKLAKMLVLAGQPDEAEALAVDAIAIRRRAPGQDDTLSWAYRVIAEVHLSRGRLDAATTAMMEACKTLLKDTGYDIAAAMYDNIEAEILTRRGELDRARPLLERSHRLLTQDFRPWAYPSVIERRSRERLASLKKAEEAKP
ncbi:MAG: tetratricopeptide repeat protein, partial [Deltaproteobacteria bacterium]|nr:tetratricopeptide repeat protein [Deltaproteobacteria bacterium]MBW2533284.1 tetratricopeptide repeat protein [Deltaproteobacteria bacterium]